MTIALYWGEFRPAAASLTTTADLDVQRWQGIREPSREVWLFRSEASPATGNLTQQLAGEDFQYRMLSTARQWKSTEAAVANFVLRELRTESIDDILPQLHTQMEAVAAQPGCIGCTLAAEIDRRQNLLGVTYWQSQAAFEQYAEWAAQHAWRDVISPVTLAVPLRLLTRRMD